MCLTLVKPNASNQRASLPSSPFSKLRIVMKALWGRQISPIIAPAFSLRMAARISGSGSSQIRDGHGGQVKILTVGEKAPLFIYILKLRSG